MSFDAIFFASLSNNLPALADGQIPHDVVKTLPTSEERVRAYFGLWTQLQYISQAGLVEICQYRDEENEYPWFFLVNFFNLDEDGKRASGATETIEMMGVEIADIIKVVRRLYRDDIQVEFQDLEGEHHQINVFETWAIQEVFEKQYLRPPQTITKKVGFLVIDFQQRKFQYHAPNQRLPSSRDDLPSKPLKSMPMPDHDALRLLAKIMTAFPEAKKFKIGRDGKFKRLW